MIPVEFRPAAATELEEAARWYDRQRPGLKDEFLAAVTEAISSMAENPRQFAVLYREVRRVLVRRFPYGVYYRLLNDRVLVVACMHARRDPRRWRSRN